MDFTREPIVETVITPREGCKLVVRNSKGVGQEEYFVDALEVVSFGHSVFYRSQEKPKAFLVPVSDYEVMEVREARIVLKNVGLDRSIKIAGGREPKAPAHRPEVEERKEEPAAAPQEPAAAQQSTRADRKRDRRRQYRRKRGRDEEGAEVATEVADEAKIELSPPTLEGSDDSVTPAVVATGSLLSSLLTPPPSLISETIGRYKENALFKDAFYAKEEMEETKEVEIPQPELGSFEMSEEDEEEIYRQRQHRFDEPEELSTPEELSVVEEVAEAPQVEEEPVVHSEEENNQL